MTTGLEVKIEVLAKEISKLKLKSDILEEQNRFLYENLNKINQEKETFSDVSSNW